MTTTIEFDATKFGGFNDAPPNLREITEKEWVRSGYFSVHSFFHEEFRQFIIKSLPATSEKTGKILNEGRDVYHSFKLCYMDEHHGYAITHDYWEGKVRVFHFGCNHKYHELSFQECNYRGISHFGNCWHVHECRECGNIYSCDSSG